MRVGKESKEKGNLHPCHSRTGTPKNAIAKQLISNNIVVAQKKHCLSRESQCFLRKTQ